MPEVIENKKYIIWSHEILARCIVDIKCRGVDGQYEVSISKVSSEKTLKQLGALFGLWVKEEASRMGEGEQYVHSKWKAWFLARIYFIDPKSSEQEMWVEYFNVLAKSNDRGQFERHSRRISLSWAKLTQVSDYMKAIEEHYQAEGRPLSIPDRHYKMWSGR